jgi:FMN phosphatase YigB (HAD superfamily)
MTLHPASGIRHPASIKNIIFDFGGVICDIDIDLTKKKFKEFGPPKGGAAVTPEEANLEFNRLFEQLEIGKISPATFRDAIRDHYLMPLTDEAINDAWNALLLDMPEHRIRLLEEIRGNYRIFLLSNSNQVHYDCYVKRFSEQYGYPDFDALFEKAWFSYRIGMKKPDREIFEFVLAQHAILPEETFFIDDTLMHVEGAASAGIQGYHLKPGEEIASLFI